MTKQVTIEDLRQMMVEGVVTFQYEKKDGSIRTAKGTLKPELITTPSKNGKNTVKDAGYTVYFDIEKDSFRCFAESKLIGVVEG